MWKNDKGNLIVPYWIIDGGYFNKGDEYVGIIDDDAPYYVPKTNLQDPNSTLIELTLDDLKEYVSNLNITKTDIDGINENLMSSVEKETFIEKWYDEKIKGVKT